jgi:very-short-patch-repair endonuclease
VSELGSISRVEHAKSTAVAIATAQDGVISRRQLIDIGFTDHTIRWWVRTGRLHRIHRGVYALGHPVLSLRGRSIAALLACGPSSVLSHRSAGVVHGLIEDEQRVIDVTTTAGRGRLERVRVHRGRRDVTRVDGLPVTTIDRTLLDLAAVLPARELERAVDAAIRMGHSHATTERRGIKGAASLNALNRRNLNGHTITRSELEERFLRLIRRAGLPDPEMNVDVGGFEVDAVWRDRRVIVELDGDRFHRQPGVRRRDRRRDAALMLAGWHVLRYGWDDVTNAPAELTALLATMSPCAPSPLPMT